MVDLLTPNQDDPYVSNEGMAMRLYCWPCRGVHMFPLEDVEKIVYALGADVRNMEQIAVDDPGEVDLGRPSSCLNEALRWADNPEIYAEHVEQGIECREAAD